VKRTERERGERMRGGRGKMGWEWGLWRSEWRELEGGKMRGHVLE